MAALLLMALFGRKRGGYGAPPLHAARRLVPFIDIIARAQADGPVFRKLPCRLVIEAAATRLKHRSLIIGSYDLRR